MGVAAAAPKSRMAAVVDLNIILKVIGWKDLSLELSVQEGEELRG
jgi:hypothetical protein